MAIGQEQRSSYFPTDNEYLFYQIITVENSTNIANNTSNITVRVEAWRTNNYTSDYGGTMYCTINGTEYSNSWSWGERPISYNSDTVLFEKTVNVPHNADGNKTVSIGAKLDYKWMSDYNYYNVSLTYIPRQANITGANNFNDEANPVLSYSNPAGNAVTSLQACISLTGAAADVGYRDVSKTGSSYTFNLSANERNTLRNSIPNANSRTVKFILKTVIGGNTYYSSKDVTFSIINANPTIGSKSYKDNNSTITAITQNNQYIVQNKSTLYFNFSNLSAKKGSSLSSLAVTISGTTKNASISGSSATLNWGALNASSNVTASMVLKDSRGNSASTSVTINVYSYNNPSANISLYRDSNYYDGTHLRVNASASSLGNHNYITSIVAKYKETSAGSYTNWGSSNNSSLSLDRDFDNTKAFNVQVTVTDRLVTTTYNLVLNKGIPIVYFDRKNRRVGINIFPTVDLQVAGDAKANSWGSNSSRKIKKNIKPMTLEDAEKILSLQAVSFDFKNENYGSDKRGFIAEDVAEVIPNIVFPEEGDSPAGLDYIAMIPYLQTIIKDQEKRIKALEEKLNSEEIQNGTN